MLERNCGRLQKPAEKRYAPQCDPPVVYAGRVWINSCRSSCAINPKQERVFHKSPAQLKQLQKERRDKQHRIYEAKVAERC